MERLPHLLNDAFCRWLKQNPNVKVLATLPIVADGNTVVIHVFLDRGRDDREGNAEMTGTETTRLGSRAKLVEPGSSACFSCGPTQGTPLGSQSPLPAEFSPPELAILIRQDYVPWAEAGESIQASFPEIHHSCRQVGVEDTRSRCGQPIWFVA